MLQTSYNVIKIANYIIEIANSQENQKLVVQGKNQLTNLRLQKILYFLQGFHYAEFDCPLFNEDLMAWQYGPVCPDVYYTFRRFGNKLIDQQASNFGTNIELSDETKVFIESIYLFLQKFSTVQLVDKTHQEIPWIIAYKAYGSVINKGLIQSFYQNEYGR